MNFKNSRMLLPNQCYDEFPVEHTGADADSLLASWIALWHPSFIAQTRDVPVWVRVDDLEDEFESGLLLAPTVSLPDIDSEFKERVKGSGLLIEGATSLGEILEKTLASRSNDTVDQDLVHDFFCLGYSYLQIELLTRHMRYASGVSETSFDHHLVEAADGALNGDISKAKENLVTCFDRLTQEREHYYAVDVYLLDLALMDSRLNTAKLMRQFETPAPFNVYLSGKSLEQLSNNTELMPRLKAGIENEIIGLIGGEYDELRSSLLHSETILANFRKGMNVFTEVLGCRPSVYGRRRFGLGTFLPQILNKLGYVGAIHATFDDGQFPEATQSKSRWEGHDGSGIDAVMRAPLDATQSSTFLKLSRSISDSMDMDHVATRCLVHWAGETNPWYELLLRSTKYTNALGKFVTVNEYFADTYDPGMHDTFVAGQYRSPFLHQAVLRKDPDPISTCVRSFKRQTRLQQCEACLFLCTMMGSVEERYATQWNDLFQVHQNLEENKTAELSHEQFDTQLESLYRELQQILQSRSVPQGTSKGIYVANTYSYPIRAFVTTSIPHVDTSKPVYVARKLRNTTHAIIDSSAMGFAWVPESKTKMESKDNVNIAEETRIRNEFIEAEIDAKSGGLKMIRDYSQRNNRLSFQLAMRLTNVRKPNDETWSSCYSKMVADQVDIAENGATVGVVKTVGRFIDHQQQPIGRFEQTFRLERGSRVLRVSVLLFDLKVPSSHPWESYYAIRFAWPNEATDIHANLQETMQKISARRFESPSLLHLDDGATPTSIFLGGIPFHQRVGTRMLDSLLVIKGETERQFEFGIGLDVKNPFREALSLHQFPVHMDEAEGSENPHHGWLFHLDARNVIATSWKPSFRDGIVDGVILRLIETEGKTCQVTLKSFRKIKSAIKENYLDETVDHCELKDEKVEFRMQGFEWSQIRIGFEPK